MRIFLSLLLVSSFLLSACAGWRDARVNPSNWFGGGRSAAKTDVPPEEINPLLPTETSILTRDRREKYDGIMVSQVTDLAIERTTTGAIIRVTGLSTFQGAYDIRLVPENGGDPVDGVLTFSLKAVQPDDQGPGSVLARTLRAGAYVSSNTLARTETVQVNAGTNSLTARPR